MLLAPLGAAIVPMNPIPPLIFPAPPNPPPPIVVPTAGSVAPPPPVKRSSLRLAILLCAAGVHRLELTDLKTEGAK